MGNLRGPGGGGSKRNEEHVKQETADFGSPCDTHVGDNAATSSVSQVKSLLVEMGFSSSLVQKAIDENGVDNLESLVEILTNTTETEHPEPKQEPDIQHEADDTRMKLLTMKFPQKLVDLALTTLGKDAEIDEIADFIAAAEFAETFAEESEETNRGDDVVLPTEKVSAPPAIVRACPSKSWRFVGVPSQKKDGDGSSLSGTAKVGESSVSKRIKVEDDRKTDFNDTRKPLRPGYIGRSRSVMETPGKQDDSRKNSYDSPSAMQPRLSQILPPNLAKRPYLFYGNIGELSPRWWSKISSFFFDIHPEHLDTRLYSALCRTEGYLHNLPTENRLYILPKPSWSTPNNISHVEPENLERMMGYPANHTNIGGGKRLAERVKLLDNCFQTDTLGYHLSVLKPMFPQGLTVLSLFSGIGGAEMALSRLGIHLRVVYSVDPCEQSRSIVKRWWQSSGQSGELVQIEDIRKLTGKKLETLVQKFGGFDLVICQNPPTPTDLSKEGKACEFDYSLFNEVVRVTKRVRDAMDSS